MNNKWFQLLAAFLLGVLVPGLLFRVHLHIGNRKSEASPTVSTHGDMIQDTVPESQQLMIPVLMSDRVIRNMELDLYVEGVVLAEMPASFETEALKAQAVVARTYALKRLQEGNRHMEGAVCTDPACCQAYMSSEAYLGNLGSESSVVKIRNAVTQTSNLVLCYNGKLAEATYFSCSGGRTEDAQAVWGTEIPYLTAVDSPGEEKSEKYWKQYLFNPSEFSGLLDRELTGAPEFWFGDFEKTQGGGVAWMMIGGMRYTGVELRKLLSLGSTNFEIKVKDDIITVSCYGHGHRVGMSQYGADAMAVLGSDYRQILSHYYQGTVIDKVGNIM